MVILLKFDFEYLPAPCHPSVVPDSKVHNFIDDYINSTLETKDERKQRSTVGESALKPLRSEKSKHVKLKSDEHRILELCDGEHTIDDIVDAIYEKYDAPRDVIEADVRETLKRMSDFKVIKM